MNRKSDSAGERDRRLILMRHAKSDWNDDSLTDHQRPLNARGRRDAPRMASWLAEQDLIPDLVLCSSSERTRETLARMCDYWSDDASLAIPEVLYNDALYHSSPDEIIRVINTDGCDADCLMVVAHNPGTAELVSWLADEPVDMPTAALAVFSFDCPDWHRLRVQSRHAMVGYIRPKALA